MSSPATESALRRPRGWVELGLLAALYLGYSLSRMVADDSPTPAAERAFEVLGWERALGLDLEHGLNVVFQAFEPLALIGSLYYASAHYLVTAVVLLWLHRARPASYSRARKVLVLATIAALAIYLLLPIAPPRLVPGYHDVLASTADLGWWGADASAPRGLGGLTNELAAFPSMHAGWALWVAWTLQLFADQHLVRVLGWSHAAITALVVIGTGNHWVLDVVAGWILVLAAIAATRVRSPRPSRRENARPGPSSPSTSATSPGST